MKKLILAVVCSAILSGCAVTPPTPAFQLTDAQLCTELGHASASGNANRVAEVIAEGKSREDGKRFTLDEGTCKVLAQTGGNAAANEAVEAQRQQQAANALMAYGQQMQAQAAQESYQQQQIANQQMQQAQQNWQMQQQQQSLNNIANAIRGY